MGKLILKNDNGTNVTIDAGNTTKNITLNSNDIVASSKTIAEFRVRTDRPNNVHVTGYHTENDGAFGSHFFKYMGTDIDNSADNGGTIIVTNSFDRYELQYDGAVSIKWFGAQSISNPLYANFDSTDSIQRALNYSTNVYIDEGTYLFSTLTPRTKSSIVGSAMDTSVLKQISTENNVKALDYGTGYVSNITIKNVVIDGNYNDTTLVNFYGRAFIFNCQFRNCTVGIQGTTYSDYCSIKYNRFTGFTQYGITLYKADGSLIEENAFEWSTINSTNVVVDGGSAIRIKGFSGAVSIKSNLFNFPSNDPSLTYCILSQDSRGIEIDSNYTESNTLCMLSRNKGAVIQGNYMQPSKSRNGIIISDVDSNAYSYTSNISIHNNSMSYRNSDIDAFLAGGYGDISILGNQSVSVYTVSKILSRVNISNNSYTYLHSGYDDNYKRKPKIMVNNSSNTKNLLTQKTINEKNNISGINYVGTKKAFTVMPIPSFNKAASANYNVGRDPYIGLWGFGGLVGIKGLSFSNKAVFHGCGTAVAPDSSTSVTVTFDSILPYLTVPGDITNGSSGDLPAGDYTIRIYPKINTGSRSENSSTVNNDYILCKYSEQSFTLASGENSFVAKLNNYVDGVYIYIVTAPDSTMEGNIFTTTNIINVAGNNCVQVTNKSNYTSSTINGSDLSNLELDSNYKVQITPSWDTTTYVTSKTRSGFTINFGTAPSGDKNVDWFITR